MAAVVPDVYTILETKWTELGATADLTKRTLSLGAQDGTTGWYAKTFAESTVQGFIIPKGLSYFLLPPGIYVRYDAICITKTAFLEGDEVTDAAGNVYIVEAFKVHRFLDTLAFYELHLAVKTVMTSAPSKWDGEEDFFNKLKNQLESHGLSADLSLFTLTLGAPAGLGGGNNLVYDWSFEIEDIHVEGDGNGHFWTMIGYATREVTPVYIGSYSCELGDIGTGIKQTPDFYIRVNDLDVFEFRAYGAAGNKVKCTVVYVDDSTSSYVETLIGAWSQINMKTHVTLGKYIKRVEITVDTLVTGLIFIDNVILTGITQPNTGWYLRSYTESTIKGVLTPQNPTVVYDRPGIRTKNISFLYTLAEVFEGDRIMDAGNVQYIITSRTPQFLANKLAFYKCEVEQVFLTTSAFITEDFEDLDDWETGGGGCSGGPDIETNPAEAYSGNTYVAVPNTGYIAQSVTGWGIQMTSGLVTMWSIEVKMRAGVGAGTVSFRIEYADGTDSGEIIIACNDTTYTLVDLKAHLAAGKNVDYVRIWSTNLADLLLDWYELHYIGDVPGGFPGL